MNGDADKHAALPPAELFAPVNLDVQLTVAQFAAWQQVTERNVRRRLATMAGVMRTRMGWMIGRRWRANER
jgi:hypothetical protein